MRKLAQQQPPIDTKQGTVSGYENGYLKARPDPFVLFGLAKALGVSMHALMAVFLANRDNQALTLDEARGIFEAHQRHGQSPEMAAAAKRIQAVENRFATVLGELERVRADLAAGRESPPDRR